MNIQELKLTKFSDSYQYTFTVFTPTYNRVLTLHRVYNSLKVQTYRNFEWLIIDDGSSDDTSNLVKNWQEENLFPIRYFYQKNSGKHVAFNRGVEKANGELFLSIDSDDSCLENALERFKYHWDTISEHEQETTFSAVTCLCQDEKGKVIGDYFPSTAIYSNDLEIRYRYNVTGEKWGFHRTKVLKEFPFPEIDGQRFIPENLIWFNIAQKYKTKFINEPLRIYFSGTNQLTKTGSPKTSAEGLMLFHRSVLSEQLNYFKFAPLKFIYSSISYTRFSFHLGSSPVAQIIYFKTLIGKILCIIGLPIGYLAYLFDNTRNSKPANNK